MQNTLNSSLSNTSSFLRGFYEWLWPTRCEICQKTSTHWVTPTVCNRCWALVYQPLQPYRIKQSVLLYSCGPYTGFWRKHFIQAKFSQNIFSYHNLQKMLEITLAHTPIMKSPDTIIAIPSLAMRTLIRNGSLVQHFYAYISKKQNLSKEKLQKHKPTQRQAKVIGKTNRYKNIRNSFTAPPSLQNKNVLLFDDVCTTGATLKDAVRAIEVHQPTSITCLTLLRSTLDV